MATSAKPKNSTKDTVERDLILNSTPEGVDIALLEDRELVELHKEKAGKQFTVGDVYLGRVTKIVPGLNAAFVDVGFEKDAFLHYTDLGPNIRTLMQVSKQAVAGNLNDLMIRDLKYEKQIVKTGKINEVLNKKQSILVQVLKEPISTKGPRLTCDLAIPGRYMVLLPFNDTIGVSKKIGSAEERKRLERLIESIRPKNFGVVVRTVAEGKSVADLHQDMQNSIDKWKEMMKGLKGANPPKKVHGELQKTNTLLRDMLNDTFNRIMVNDRELFNELTDYINTIAPDRKGMVQFYNGQQRSIFDHFGVTRQIKSLFGKTVTIPGGAYLVIEHTEALHVIDVNSGHKIGNRDDQETTALKVNLSAAKEVARQLRLRDIGGIIVVDFIDQRKHDNKKQIHKALKDHMKSDRAKHSVLPLSKFGLMQITRERTRPQVNIATQEDCPTCGGTGKIEASILVTDKIEDALEEIMREHKKVNLYVHPFVDAYLKKGIMSKRVKWSRLYKRWIGIYPNQNYHLTEYHFFDKEGEEISL